MLDALLNGTHNEIRNFATVADWMFEAHKTYGKDGGLSRMITPLDRAPLAMCLTESAGSELCEMLRLMLNDIWRAYAANPRFRRQKTSEFFSSQQPVIFLKHNTHYTRQAANLATVRTMQA